MRKPWETSEAIAKFRYMINSPMPEHNIHTKYIFTKSDKIDEEIDKDNKTEDKK